MTEHLSPEEAQAAARAITERQASVVGGQDSAGIYGDVAGRSDKPPAQSQEEVAAGLHAAGGQAASADPEQLLAMIEAQQKQMAALVERLGLTGAPEPAPPDTRLGRHVDGNAPGWIHNLMADLEDRLAAIEGKLGL